MKRTRIWVELDSAGNVDGNGYELWEFGELLTYWVDPNPDPFSTPCEALARTRQRAMELHGQERPLF